MGWVHRDKDKVGVIGGLLLVRSASVAFVIRGWGIASLLLDLIIVLCIMAVKGEGEIEVLV